MQLLVYRMIYDDICTVGDFYIDGAFTCHTLEPVVREIPGQPVETWKIQNKTAIPYGLYNVTITYSEHFKRLMPLILDVPGFEGVRIHWGNNSVATDGCLLLGETESKDFIGSSVAAFNDFFPLLQNAINDNESVTIEYIDGRTVS